MAEPMPSHRTLGVIRRPIGTLDPELLHALQSDATCVAYLRKLREVLAGLEYARSGMLLHLREEGNSSANCKHALAISCAKYLLRACGRPTPYGYFAGVCPATWRADSEFHSPCLSMVLREAPVGADSDASEEETKRATTAGLRLNPTATAVEDWLLYYQPTGPSGLACPATLRLLRLNAPLRDLLEMETDWCSAAPSDTDTPRRDLAREGVLLPSFFSIIAPSLAEATILPLREAVEELAGKAQNAGAPTMALREPADLEQQHATVDMAFSREQGWLPERLRPALTHAARAVEMLMRRDDPLAGLRQRFRERYDTAFVPLTIVASSEFGIGTDGAKAPNSALTLRPAIRPDAAVAGFVSESDVDLASFPGIRSDGDGNDRDLTRYICTRVVSSREGPPHLTLLGTGGDAVSLLARAARCLPDLASLVTELCEHFERIAAPAKVAEVVYASRYDGNASCRAPTYSFEIPIFGHGHRATERQILPSSLELGLVGERFVLRERASGCEIIPRISTAQNFLHPQVPYIIQVLGALQHESQPAGVSWQWGQYATVGRLPRVRWGDITVSPRSWQPLAGWTSRHPELTDDRLRAWCQAHDVPRFVYLYTEHGDCLPLDLDAHLCFQILSSACRRAAAKGASLRLLEFEGASEALRHEVTVAEAVLLVDDALGGGRRSPVHHPASRAEKRTEARSVEPERVTYYPGGPWHYLRIFAGPQTLDDIVREEFPKLRRAVHASSSEPRMFFIKYADPDTHLRLRLLAQKDAQDVLQPLINLPTRPEYRGRIHAIEIATYKPEVYQYGSGASMDAWHSWFSFDSAFSECLAGRFSADSWEFRIPWSLLWCAWATVVLRHDGQGVRQSGIPRGALSRIRRHCETAKLLARDLSAGVCTVEQAIPGLFEEMAHHLTARSDELLREVSRARAIERMVHLHVNRALPDIPMGIEAAIRWGVKHVAGWLEHVGVNPRNRN